MLGEFALVSEGSVKTLPDFLDDLHLRLSLSLLFFFLFSALSEGYRFCPLFSNEQMLVDSLCFMSVCYLIGFGFSALLVLSFSLSPFPPFSFGKFVRQTLRPLVSTFSSFLIRIFYIFMLTFVLTLRFPLGIS